MNNIPYHDIDDLILRDTIGGEGSQRGLPKIGTQTIFNILQKLKEQPSTIRERELESETEHVIWRREGQRYFTNPMLEELYSAREVKPFYFSSKLEARAAFLAVSSSVFYVYWVAYGDMFHLNLGDVRAFPLPEEEELEPYEERIMDISDRLWDTMEDGFNSSIDNFENYEMQKPIIEEADEVMGELYGLTKEEISFVQNYHSEYGGHGPEDSQLSEY